MSLRTRLLLLFTVTIVIVVAIVGASVSLTLRSAFEAADEQRRSALVRQFRAEFARNGEDVVNSVASIAERDSTLRMAAELARPGADAAQFVGEAAAIRRAYPLDLLEFVAGDGTIISSAQWSARFGYKDETFTPENAQSGAAAFLKREELPGGETLALAAERAVRVGESTIYVVGGRNLDREFLASLALPAGMRVLLYRNLAAGNQGQGVATESLLDASGTAQSQQSAQQWAPLIEQLRRQPAEQTRLIDWTGDPADADMVEAIPLTGSKGELLGALLVASSRREVVELDRKILKVTLLVGALGVLLGFGLSTWAAARVTQPVEQLADAARQVTRGNWDARVYIESSDELGELAAAFNRMTHELGDQRDRLVQAERVAAWRELARRLAHELKNPLFPLQITVENLVRARQSAPELFNEVFEESTQTLLAELGNMRTIVGRFSDFAKMPSPTLRPVQINELMEQALRLAEAQQPGASKIETDVQLDPQLPLALADRDLIYRAISNLILNALDAMPQGGTLTVRTAATETHAKIEVSDTGQGLTPEECARLFTPYYTTKQHGTGLGLAIVQSVVSDHLGRVWVESKPGAGTTFHIELPLTPPPRRAEIRTAEDAKDAKA